MQVIGNYSLNVRIGDELVNIFPQMIKELTITQDIERLLPTFKMSLRDATKILAELMPYDKTSNKIQFELSRTSDVDDINIFDFVVKRRNVASPEDIYTVEGLLDIPDILTENRSKAFTGNIKTSLESIVSNLGINRSYIGASLNYEKSFLQPNWSDAKLLRYLTENMIGKTGESGYYCYVMPVLGETILVFKSLEDLLTSPVSYNFIVSHKEYKDYYPIGEYQIFDNSQLIMDLGAKLQKYIYFNYDLGTFVDAEVGIEDCPTLSEFLLLDGDRNTDSALFTHTGRSNAFTSDFKGRVQNSFYNRVNGMVHMWAGTWGLPNITPGDIVQVVFGESFNRGDLFTYQHSGLWMVKRVVHIIGSTFMSNLLLVRCGIDTDMSTTLLESTQRKR